MKKTATFASLLLTVLYINPFYAIESSIDPDEFEDVPGLDAYKLHHTFVSEGVHFHSGGEDLHYYPIAAQLDSHVVSDPLNYISIPNPFTYPAHLDCSNTVYYYSHFEMHPIIYNQQMAVDVPHMEQ